MIKKVATMEEAALCRGLAAQVWGEPAACSVAQMSVHAKYGGVLLLAVEAGTPVGFLFSFPALYQGEWVLWSHETAVLPGYLHQGIGTKLKLMQRAEATKLGYDKIAWTFDPLVSRNAYFNLEKLGAAVSEYKINAYGMDETDNVNQGMETDRFIAVWDVDEDVNKRNETESLPANSTTEAGWIEFAPDQTPLLRRDPSWLTNREMMVATDIPLNFEHLVAEDRKLAVAWRLAFRAAALELLEAGLRPKVFQVQNSFARYIWKR